MRHLLTSLYRLLFPLRVGAAALLFALPAAVCVICLPGRERRRRAACRAGRIVFPLAGMPLKVSGLENLPEGPSFLACNHASYLDGPLLMAALPPRFGFVSKREVMRVPLLGRLMARLGSEFVERFDTKTARNDANRLIQLARDGVSLGVFPEGTFCREPGLRPFHLGAFIAATRAGIPVVPMVIHGSRDILPDGTWWPRPGNLWVEVLEPIFPAGKRGDDARTLCAAVRAQILEHCSETERIHARMQSAPATISAKQE